MENPGNPSGGDLQPHAEQPKAPDGQGAAKPPRSWKRILLWSAGIGLLVIAATMGGAEYYTGQPYFCRSCHIMEPYYQSWSKDVHGAKLAIRCVDCHYAPGERFTFHAKFKGLSQATSYFSGRAGASRPRAHVADASCMISECHGDNKFVDARLTIGEVRTEERIIGETVTQVQRTPTVHFLHNKHLNIGETLEANIHDLNAMERRLKNAAPADVFELIMRTARLVEPMAAQAQRLRQELAGRDLSDIVDDAIEFVRLTDMNARLNQLAGLTCASCHGYDASGGKHFAVDKSTCYTCHFANQDFNAGTGKCLNCHEPPTRRIFIHGAPTSQGEKPSIMDHRDILERNIDCASCHLDVVQGHAVVTARECTHCHDRASYLEGFDARDLEKVQEYHRVHVRAQRARCPDCHHAVKHELVEPTLVATSEGFVKPILDECQHCHPDHHREQVELLMGLGGVGVEQPMPNAMFGSRVNCRACHVRPGTDFKGTPLIEATAETCIACHEEKYGQLLDQWLEEISAYMTESEKAVEKMDQRIAEYRAQGRSVPERVLQLVDMAEYNIHLVRIGNGIHNKNYATRLLDLADDYLREALALLTASPQTATAPADG